MSVLFLYQMAENRKLRKIVEEMAEDLEKMTGKKYGTLNFLQILYILHGEPQKTDKEK